MSESSVVTGIGLAIAMLGPISVATVSERFVRHPNRLGPLLFVQAALVLIVAAVLAIVLLLEERSLSSIGLNALTFQSLASGLALAAFFIYVFSPAVCWVLRRVRLGGFDKGLLKLQGLPVWYLALAVVIGGVAEEVLYRGYAVERLGTLTGSLWVGGVVPVVVFAAAHLPMWGWGPAIATLVSGAIFTVFFLWQRDLAACIVAHVVTDFVGIVIAPLFGRRRSS